MKVYARELILRNGLAGDLGAYGEVSEPLRQHVALMAVTGLQKLSDALLGSDVDLEAHELAVLVVLRPKDMPEDGDE